MNAQNVTRRAQCCECRNMETCYVFATEGHDQHFVCMACLLACVDVIIRTDCRPLAVIMDESAEKQEKRKREQAADYVTRNFGGKPDTEQR